MVSQSFIVWKYDQGNFVPHTHPVFAGQIAYDLPGSQQEIPIDEEFNVRAFTSSNEVAQAINDYMRQAPNPEIPEPWYIKDKNIISNFTQGFKTR